MSEELKPCWRCGNEVYLANNKARGEYFIFCRHCFAETKIFSTKQEAIEAWNRRANDDKG